MSTAARREQMYLLQIFLLALVIFVVFRSTTIPPAQTADARDSLAAAAAVANSHLNDLRRQPQSDSGADVVASVSSPNPKTCGRIVTTSLNTALSLRHCENSWYDLEKGPPLFVSVTSPVSNMRLRERQRRDWLRPVGNDLPYMFFVGQPLSASIQAEVDEEMRLHQDVVQINVLDTYENLTVKSVAACAWSTDQATRGRSVVGEPWFWLKTEDYMNNSWDAVLDVVEQALGGQGDEKEDGTAQYSAAAKAAGSLYAGGAIFGGGKVMRRGRWGCPERHCPYSTFPVRYAGGQYMLGHTAARTVAKHGLAGLMPWRGDPYPIEDHYIASCLQKRANIEVKREKRLWWKGGQPYNPPWVTDIHGFHFLEHRD